RLIKRLDICFPHSFEMRWWMIISDFLCCCRFCLSKHIVRAHLTAFLCKQERVNFHSNSYRREFQSFISPTLAMYYFCSYLILLVSFPATPLRLHGCDRHKCPVRTLRLLGSAFS